MSAAEVRDALGESTVLTVLRLRGGGGENGSLGGWGLSPRRWWVSPGNSRAVTVSDSLSLEFLPPKLLF